jgi:hypothetical protein
MLVAMLSVFESPTQKSIWGSSSSELSMKYYNKQARLVLILKFLCLGTFDPWYVHPRMVRTRLIQLDTLSIFDVEIEHMPRYLAISHVWSENLFPPRFRDTRHLARGVTILKRLLVCTGGPKALSLRQFISRRVLQVPDGQLPKGALFWVDTWCIDQNDPEDKERQIPLMGRIYRDAAFVQIITEHKFTFRQDDWDSVCDELKRARGEDKSLQGFDSRRAIRRYQSQAVQDALKRGGQMLDELTSTKWFQRLWTAQEYILARVAYFTGGDGHNLHFDDEDVIRLYYLWVNPHARALKPGDDTLIERLDSLMLLLKMDGKGCAKASNFAKAMRIPSDPGIFATVMQLASDRQCLYKEDEIYGLMAASQITITYIPHANTNAIWQQWWDTAVEKQSISMVMLPKSKPTSNGPYSNCAKPEFDNRCEAIGFCQISEIDSQLARSYAKQSEPMTIDHGTINVRGRVAGICTSALYLGRWTSYESTYQCVTKELGEDLQLIQEVYGVLAGGLISRENIALWVEEAKYHHLVGNEAEWIFESHMGITPVPEGKTYLVTVKNATMETRVIVVTDDNLNGAGSLIAVDLSARTGSGAMVLLIVRSLREEGERQSGDVLHKVGTTLPVFEPYRDFNWIRKKEQKDAKERFGMFINSTWENFQIGGASCPVCHPPNVKPPLDMVDMAERPNLLVERTEQTKTDLRLHRYRQKRFHIPWFREIL